MSALLEVRNLRVRYGAIEAVKGIDFSLAAGRITTLLGANGAGKSSTLLALSGLLKAILFGVGPYDPVSFLLAPAVIVAIAVIAAYLPARRASQLSPMDAMRCE
jgi:ABC-type hemin transport system ATPase subunit